VKNWLRIGVLLAHGFTHKWFHLRSSMGRARVCGAGRAAA
jgi:hypothetical protein